MFLVLAFYRVRFSVPFQICVQECENHKRIDTDQHLNAYHHYRAVLGCKH
jgi:hypothetical protein